MRIRRTRGFAGFPSTERVGFSGQSIGGSRVRRALAPRTGRAPLRHAPAPRAPPRMGRAPPGSRPGPSRSRLHVRSAPSGRVGAAAGCAAAGCAAAGCAAAGCAAAGCAAAGCAAAGCAAAFAAAGCAAAGCAGAPARRLPAGEAGTGLPGHPPGGQPRETIRSPKRPPGAATVTESPARRPMSARPTGEVLLIRPSAGDASWLPTIV